jgi:integrase
MSEHTKNTYERSLTTIRKGLGVEAGLDFLSDHARVIAWIDSHPKYKPNSKKVMYIAVVSTLKTSALYPEAVAEYKKKIDALNRQVAEASEEQALTPEEAEKFVEWPLVLKTVEDIGAAVSDLASYQEYLIVSLYTELPPLRLDYAEMKVLPAEPNTLEGNYLIFGGATKKPYILLTQYKTARRYGEQRIALPKKLVAIVKEWRKMQDTEYLLVSPASNNAMPAWELGQTITRVFEKHLGKSVGVSVLRHSYITWMRRDDLAPKKSNQLAKDMLHSVGMSQLYRRTD